MKSAKRPFDPQVFLAKVGTGKTILKYRKGRDHLRPRRRGRQDFLHPVGHGQGYRRFRAGQIGSRCHLEPCAVFWRGMSEWPDNPHWNRAGVEECLITSITRKSMLAALRKEPKLSELFVSYLITRSNRTEEDLIDQLFNSSEKRLARLLVLLANFGKSEQPTPIDASINQGTLAEMIGTTRSRVSFFLNKFRKLGLISYNGNIEVHRSLLNAVLYEKPELARDENPTEQSGRSRDKLLRPLSRHCVFYNASRASTHGWDQVGGGQLPVETLPALSLARSRDLRADSCAFLSRSRSLSNSPN